MKTFRCHLAVTSDGQQYTATSLNMPEVSASAATEEQAIADARDTLQRTIERLRESGEDIPWVKDYKVPAKASAVWVLVDVR